MKFLEGKVKKFMFRSDDGAFGVAVLVDDQGREHKIVGSIMANPGEHIRVGGEFIEHPKFGAQFKVKNFEYGDVSKDKAGIVGYLERLPNIGPVRAQTIFNTFGEETFRVIEEEPEMLVRAPGITFNAIGAIREAYMLEKESRDLIVFLKKFDLTDHKISKIMTQYGSNLKQVLESNPYKMISDIDGFGWKIVDTIALTMGVERDSKKRIRAGVDFVLRSATDDGHTFLPADTLHSLACKALQAPAARIAEVVGEMIEGGDLTSHDGCVYLPGLRHSEESAAESLYEIATSSISEEESEIGEVAA